MELYYQTSRILIILFAEGSLVEGLRQAEVPVQVELLRPGSYQALDQHLR